GMLFLARSGSDSDARTRVVSPSLAPQAAQNELLFLMPVIEVLTKDNQSGPRRERSLLCKINI
ncbi:MAG TPA: hypothetical protein PKH08_02480, partial [Clostridia bacterium]|nr:hypothetical protein [Clostridia bacterium]